MQPARQTRHAGCILRVSQALTDLQREQDFKTFIMNSSLIVNFLKKNLKLVKQKIYIKGRSVKNSLFVWSASFGQEDSLSK